MLTKAVMSHLTHDVIIIVVKSGINIVIFIMSIELCIDYDKYINYSKCDLFNNTKVIINLSKCVS